MRITLSPCAGNYDDALPVVQGEVLTYRGLSYDLSPIEDGDIYEPGYPIEGVITRSNGELVVKLVYNYNKHTSLDHQPSCWEDYTFIVTNGQCPCPIARKTIQETTLEV